MAASRDLSLLYVKEGVCCRDESIVWLSMFLMHIRPFELISKYKKRNLTWKLHVQN